MGIAARASARVWPIDRSTSVDCACTASNRAQARWWCCCSASRSLVRLAAPDPSPADAGYRVVAPDLPGYNASHKPPGVRNTDPGSPPSRSWRPVAGLGPGTAIAAGPWWQPVAPVALAVATALACVPRCGAGRSNDGLVAVVLCWPCRPRWPSTISPPGSGLSHWRGAHGGDDGWCGQCVLVAAWPGASGPSLRCFDAWGAWRQGR